MTDELALAALAALDHVLEERPGKLGEEIAHAVRCLVRYRDRLIERGRAGPTSNAVHHRLVRTNAILSVVVGGEYPLVGVRSARIREARDALADLMQEVDVVAEADGNRTHHPR